MAYSPRMIANAFLVNAGADGRTLVHLEIQNLVYFAHAWHLAIHNEPLINEEVKVWPLGPTIDSLFHELKAHGRNPLNYLNEMDLSTGHLSATAPPPDDGRAWGVVAQVWKRYGALSLDDLRSLAHAEDSPWCFAKMSGQTCIPDSLIKSYHRMQLNKQIVDLDSNQSSDTHKK